MSIKFTSVATYLLFSGTVAWAFLPMPSPQPSGLPVAVGAGVEPVTTAMQQGDPILTCIDACQDAFDLAVANSTQAFKDCVAPVIQAAKDLAAECVVMTYPPAKADCELRVKLLLGTGTSICEGFQEEDDQEALDDLDACVEACLTS